MNIIGLLDAPSSGSLCIEGQETAQFRPSASARLRNATIGFVFQAFHLLPHLTALDNVALPLIYRGVGKKLRHGVAAGKCFTMSAWVLMPDASPLNCPAVTATRCDRAGTCRQSREF
ncbi:MAG: hypothetical protein WDN29_02675 [Methylovirgula sp.]